MEILRNVRDAEGALGDATLTARTGRFAEHLREGQRAGEFGAFDPDVIALALTGAIDAFVSAAHIDAAHEDGLDLRRAGAELADAFERATAAERGSEGRRS